MNKLQCYYFNSEDDSINLLFEFKDEPSYDTCYGLAYWADNALNLEHVHLSPAVTSAFKPITLLSPRHVYKRELVSYDFLIALLNQTNNLICNKTIIRRIDELIVELVNLILINWDHII